MSTQSKVIILGAGGRFGRAASEQFEASGWCVTKVVRPGRLTMGSPNRTIECEATDPAKLTEACSGQDVIVNALNPPYAAWKTELPKITRAVIAATRANGATVVVPGNVYNFGPDLPHVLSSATPQRSEGKGGLRIKMERQYRDSGVRTIILRGGDFIEATKTGNWFDSVITPKAMRGKITYPGPRNLPHAWAYLPDMARAAVMLATRRDDLPTFADVPFPGYTMTGLELGDLVSRAVGHNVKVGKLPWWLISIFAIFSPTYREILEMRYLWNKPHSLSGKEMMAILPDFQATPASEAIGQSLGVTRPQADAKAMLSA